MRHDRGTFAWMLVLICAALVFAPKQSMAQRGGGFGGRGAGSGGGSAGMSKQDDTPEMKEFRRLMALQATPEQISHFKALSKTTQQARSLAQSLRRQGNGGVDYAGQSALLEDALEDTRTGTNDFMKSFSAAQDSGLKKLAHSVRKSDSEVDKSWTRLSQQMTRPKMEDQKIVAGAEHLDKALEKLQHDQSALATEMSIGE